MSEESNRHSSGSTGGGSAPQSSGGYGGGRPSSGPGGRPSSGPGGRPSGPGGRPSGPGGRPGGRPGGGGGRFGGGGGDRRGGGGRRRFPRRKISRFTIENTAFIDYRNYRVLKEFLTERGKIIPRRISGNSARHQRMLTRAIKRARFMALLPFTSRD